MPRWNNNLEVNCKNIMDNVIKNIKSDLYQQLLIEVVESNVENNKKILEQFIRSKLNLTATVSKHTNKYWISRGWTTNESYIKSKENKQKNCKSVFSQHTWLEKINPVTGVHYTYEEANYECNSRRPIRKEYWVKKGYTEIDAELLAITTKDSNNKKGSDASATTKLRKITAKRCNEYYIIRGATLTDASMMRAKAQSTFSKEICVEKYGEVKGLAIWQARQYKWQSTLDAKSDEEKSRINRLKISKGISISKAEKIILEEIKLIIPEVEHQFTLFTSGKKQYIYDIMANKKIIEYNGDFWHANPIMYLANNVNPRTKLTAAEKWKIDELKLQHAIDQGYEVLVVWESEFNNNQQGVINKCIKFLTQ